MKLTELKSSGFDVYTEDPYGNGWTEDAVRKGEMLPHDDGHAYEFISASVDGKHVVVVGRQGTPQKMRPTELGAFIVPKGMKPGKKIKESVTDDRDRELSVGDYAWVNDWSVEDSFKITEINGDKVTLLIPKTAGKPEHKASFKGSELRKDRDGSASKGKATYEATQAVTSTAKTYKLKKYAGAGLGMWIKDAEADGFKVKKISGDADKDNDVWNAFDGNRKVGSFSDEDRYGWLQAKI